MKRFFAIVLCVACVLSLVACGKKETPVETKATEVTEAPAETKVPETSDVTEAPEVTEVPAETESQEVVISPDSDKISEGITVPESGVALQSSMSVEPERLNEMNKIPHAPMDFVPIFRFAHDGKMTGAKISIKKLNEDGTWTEQNGSGIAKIYDREGYIGMYEYIKRHMMVLGRSTSTDLLEMDNLREDGVYNIIYYNGETVFDYNEEIPLALYCCSKEEMPNTLDMSVFDIPKSLFDDGYEEVVAITVTFLDEVEETPAE